MADLDCVLRMNPCYIECGRKYSNVEVADLDCVLRMNPCYIECGRKYSNVEVADLDCVLRMNPCYIQCGRKYSNVECRSSQWKPHILDTVNRANQHLGFLRRILLGTPNKLRETAYLALVILRVLWGYLGCSEYGKSSGSSPSSCNKISVFHVCTIHYFSLLHFCE